MNIIFIENGEISTKIKNLSNEKEHITICCVLSWDQKDNSTT